ncbi:cell division protein FtsX [Phaeovulum sp.]|uniref:cell division protein FtsX n=1 Tax=Phaeovulum sp. TaxID=2934796 RepID=UPI003566B3DA
MNAPGKPQRQAVPPVGRVVPPSGFTARLTVFSAGAMALLAVFALALSMATGRLSERWSDALARTATVRISAPASQMATQTDAVLRVLEATPGIASARALDTEEVQALLGPWFGPDLPIASLPLPQLVELVETEDGPDAEGLRLRLAAEAPGAVFDDHARWRRPLVEAAVRLRVLGLASLGLIALSTAAMIVLAAQAALAANGQVIRVLRLVGARDTFIARAFVRRFSLRALSGAAAGTAVGMAALAALPATGDLGGLPAELGFVGAEWLVPLLIPPLAALVAWAATRAAAFRMLGGIR